jgi:hypothetical protein
VSTSVSPGAPVSSPRPQWLTPADRPDPARVARRDPDAVCRAFAATSYLVDSAEDDTSWNDAGRRAAAFAEPRFAALLRRAPQVGGGSAWGDLVRHRGFSEVSVSRGDQPPPDTAVKAQRMWGVTYRLRGRDGWTGPTEDVVIACAMQKISGRWYVAEQTLL